jgi:uncharacterized LabA/DUF88 family protein
MNSDQELPVISSPNFIDHAMKSRWLKYCVIVLFILWALVERSPIPLVFIPVILLVLEQHKNQASLWQHLRYYQEKIDTLEDDQQLLEVSLHDSKENLTQKVVHAESLLDSFEKKFHKFERKFKKYQDRIGGQQTLQKDTLAQIHHLSNETQELADQVNSLVHQLYPTTNIVKLQKTQLMLIDGANLHHGARDLGIEIDYVKLRSYLAENVAAIESRIYLAHNPNSDGFYHYLETLSYIVKIKQIIRQGDGSVKGNVDVNLAVDMIAEGSQYKTVFLVSGDGDFLPAVKKLQQQGVKVVVVAPLNQTNDMLRKSADKYIDIAEIQDEIKQTTPNSIQHQY